MAWLHRIMLLGALVSYIIAWKHLMSPRSAASSRIVWKRRHAIISATPTTLFLGDGDSIIDGNEESEHEELDVYGQLRNELKGTNLFLIGMMGSGKSSIGDRLGRKMGYRYIDTDEVAEYMIEMPISEFFAQGGEKEFREVEHKVLMELAQYTRTIISTGGGIVESNENWGILHHGVVVFLDATPKDIFTRLSDNPEEIAKRPLLQGGDALEKLEEIREKRINKYNEADVTIPIPSDLKLEESEELVAAAVLKAIRENPPQWLTWKRKKEEEMSKTFKDKNEDAAEGIQYLQ